MPTNDEIREQEDMQMAHYKSLTPDEQADRERSLMDKARADEREDIAGFKNAEFVNEYANKIRAAERTRIIEVLEKLISEIPTGEDGMASGREICLLEAIDAIKEMK